MNALMHYGTLWGLILSTAGVAATLLAQQRQSNATIYPKLTARLSQLFRSWSIHRNAKAFQEPQLIRNLRQTDFLGGIGSAQF